ncbi:hypothetical protein [Streptomyces yaizuensis]|uniref:Uncharacterized protein n=1 Tax=Streptomyces yaizuensis TaxID=2989713 RepID=A0ABQ5P6H7_9ACTN|nr:hypothetical protein [Streptomyces sp. YSPA8]GLF98206.1 hypothetical protein SYYSPA8_27935 [Streptomyces sp. YSPA8]
MPPTSADQAARPYWTTRLVRACDVQEGDVVLIAGRWREVVDVYNSGDDPKSDLGQDSHAALEIRKVIDRANSVWTAVRFVTEEQCSGLEISTRVEALLWCTLVEVQVEAPEPRGGQALLT